MDWVNLVLCLLIAVVVGRLAALQQERAAEAHRRAREAQALFAINRILATPTTAAEAAPAVLARLAADSAMDRIWFGIKSGGSHRAAAPPPARGRAGTRGHARGHPGPEIRADDVGTNVQAVHFTDDVAAGALLRKRFVPQVSAEGVIEPDWRARCPHRPPDHRTGPTEPKGYLHRGPEPAGWGGHELRRPLSWVDRMHTAFPNVSRKVVARLRSVRRHPPRGQSVVEFALILPVLLVLMAVTLDLGRLAFARVTLENAAREGAFQASKTPSSYAANQPCPSAGTTNLVVCRTQLESRGSPVTIAPADIQMACSPADCDPGIGNTVTVTVSGQFALLTPILAPFFGSTTFTISSNTSAQIETLPTPNFTPPWATPTPAPSASASPSPSPTSAACQIPSAGFTFTTSPPNGTAPLTISVVDTSTFTACGIDTWLWTWGDGTSFFGQAPGSHNFGSAGDYPVTLTVTNPAGGNTTGAVIIHVK